MASKSFRVVISRDEPLDKFTIPYLLQCTKGFNMITDGIANNYTVVAGITVVVNISCSGFCFACCMSVNIGAYGVSASNHDVGNLDRPLGDLYRLKYYS